MEARRQKRASRSPERKAKTVENSEKNLPRPGRYRHFKGREYELIGVATHSETGETLVIYRALYGEGALWARPLSMWEETVERDGKVSPRFTYIGDENDP